MGRREFFSRQRRAGRQLCACHSSTTSKEQKHPKGGEPGGCRAKAQRPQQFPRSRNTLTGGHLTVADKLETLSEMRAAVRCPPFRVSVPCPFLLSNRRNAPAVLGSYDDSAAERSGIPTLSHYRISLVPERAEIENHQFRGTPPTAERLKDSVSRRRSSL
jgi:hypothetical protein